MHVSVLFTPGGIQRVRVPIGDELGTTTRTSVREYLALTLMLSLTATASVAFSVSGLLADGTPPPPPPPSPLAPGTCAHEVNAVLVLDRSPGADDTAGWQTGAYIQALLEAVESAPLAFYKVVAFGEAAVVLWPRDSAFGRSAGSQEGIDAVVREINASFHAVEQGASGTVAYLNALLHANRTLDANRTSDSALLRLVSFVAGAPTSYTSTQLVHEHLNSGGVEQYIFTRSKADPQHNDIAPYFLSTLVTGGTYTASNSSVGGMIEEVAWRDFGAGDGTVAWTNYTTGLPLATAAWGGFSC